MFERIYFDLDGTLYTAQTGLWDAIRVRIHRYLVDEMKFSEVESPHIRQRYLEQYGTTLRGLQAEYAIDAVAYLRFVHDIPLRQFIAPDPGLRDLLLGIPSARWVFTNSDRYHAGRVMEILGITDCFEGVIDVIAMDFDAKPNASAFHKALALSGNPNPQNCLFLDDYLQNVDAARQLGFNTILVGPESPESNGHPRIDTIHQLSNWDGLK
ncbi:MAG: HAD family hydrolase [Anaerolineales bacterium]